MAPSGDAQDGAEPAPAAKPDFIRTMLVLYGSETGNSQEIAEDIDRIAQKLRFKSTLAEMNSVQPSALLRHSLVVFVVPTTGQGDFPRNAATLWKKLLRKKLLPGCLNAVNFTSFGLGDTSYPRFNWAARKLVRRLEQLGATQFYPIGEADERHPDGLDELYLRWATKFEEHLLATYPIPDGHKPLPDDVPLPPRYLLRWESAEAPTPVPAPNVEADQAPPAIGARTATLVSNERITAPDHFQDVRLLKLDIPDDENGSKLDLAPGDTITMYPRNQPEDAQKLIEWMSWESIADTPISWPGSRAPAGLHREDDGSPPPTLRAVVLGSLDITAVPRRSFLRNIAHFASDPYQKERLLEFTEPKFLDEYYDYATRPRRTILEILHEFSSVKVPPERALDTFPLIRGREFSIANGGEHLRHPSDGSLWRVEIVAALVRYKTILRKERVGLCSRFIDTMEPGTLVPVLHRKGLTPFVGPERDSRPLVGVATGTGVAPIRSLLQHRASTSGPRVAVDGTAPDATITAPANPPSHLFFGFRSAEADFHFSDEWTSLYPGLTLHPAESRPAPSSSVARIYVQDVMTREAALLADMVHRRAIFLICGGSHRMAQAVREAVISAIGGDGAGEEERKKAFEGVDWIQEIW